MGKNQFAKYGRVEGGDALAAHARDELGITEELKARPVLASLASELAFSVGAIAYGSGPTRRFRRWRINGEGCNQSHILGCVSDVWYRIGWKINWYFVVDARKGRLLGVVGHG